MKTDNEKLAIFAGYKLKTCDDLVSCMCGAKWWVRGASIINYNDFNPLKDWNHLKFVLEALVKNHKYEQGYSWMFELRELMEKAEKCWNEDKDFNFPQAIIDAAMVVIESEAKDD